MAEYTIEIPTNFVCHTVINESHKPLFHLKTMLETYEQNAVASGDIYLDDNDLKLGAKFLASYCRALRLYLETQNVKFYPLDYITYAFEDLANGLINPLFKRDTGKQEKLPFQYAELMGIAAQAVTITPTGKKKEVLRKAAKKLMIREKTLENFVRNMSASDSRIKSSAAKFWSRDMREFDFGGSERLFPNLTDEQYVTLLLAMLTPVPKKYRDPRYKHRRSV
jgi:hypothetical protein